jgi:NTE family protein
MRRRSKEPETTPSRVGLALAGGGPGGAIYEIGALRALDEALPGIDFNQLAIYVGVSAGGFITSCLANDLTPAQMCRAILSREPGVHPFVPGTFLTPSYRELTRRTLRVPRLLLESLWAYATDGVSLLGGSFAHLGRALPVGFFDNEPIRAYLEKIFTIKGRSDDFRRLGKKLIVVGADLDSGQPVRFGGPGFDHVPISRAVQASTALPGLYSPVEVDGRFYVDGVLLKTLHASVALEAGADLLLCINPIVPVDTARAVEAGMMKRGKLTERGLPTVLSQALRTLVHSRLEVGMKAYAERFRADIVMLEPHRDDYRMFFTNIFGFSDRRAVCEHAYRATREELRRRFDELAPVFARHGVTLCREVLWDESRDLWQGVGLALPGKNRRLAALDQLDQALDRLDGLVAEAGG